MTLKATCPACFKLVGVRRPVWACKDSDALIVAAHGFRTYKNTRDGKTYQRNSCPGSQEEPFEHSCWGTINQRHFVETCLTNYRRDLAQIRTHTLSFSGPTGPVNPGDPRWDVMQQREIATYEERIRKATQEAADLTCKINTWVRKPLPSQGPTP